MSCSVPYTPIVVAKLAFTGQTASLPTTTVYTSAEDGDYEIAVYVTVAEVTTEVQSSISWEDEYRSYSMQITAASGNYGSFLTVAHIPTGNVIQISATSFYFGNLPTSYDIFVTVTKK